MKGGPLHFIHGVVQVQPLAVSALSTAGSNRLIDVVGFTFPLGSDFSCVGNAIFSCDGLVSLWILTVSKGR